MSVTAPPRRIAPQQTLLGRALLANAAFSATTGIVLVLGATTLDDVLAVDALVLGGLGVGLLVYAVDLAVLARSARWVRRGGMMAIIADLAWVAGAMTLVAFTSVLSPQGTAALAAVTAVVAALAALQMAGLRRFGRRA